eukprot:6491866-Amphidinium_carterae.1
MNINRIHPKLYSNCYVELPHQHTIRTCREVCWTNEEPVSTTPHHGSLSKLVAVWPMKFKDAIPLDGNTNVIPEQHQTQGPVKVTTSL